LKYLIKYKRYGKKFSIKVLLLRGGQRELSETTWFDLGVVKVRARSL